MPGFARCREMNDEIITRINDGLSLIQKRDGLTFGSDAYLLAAYVRRQPNARAADLGSGTGVIPLLMLSRDKAATVDAFEIQHEFAGLITRNAELNGFAGRLFSVNSDIRALPAEYNCRFDIVTSNPPYMKTSGDQNESERKFIARHEVMGGIVDFCNTASRLLKHGGLFYVVWRPDRLTELISALCGAGLEPKRMTFVHSRVGLPPCLVLCEAKKFASAGVYVTPPLIMYTADKSGCEYTPELSHIYENGDFDEHYKRP